MPGPSTAPARRTVLDAVWEHRTALERGFIRPLVTRAATEDVGEIAVVQDEGDLVLTSNILRSARRHAALRAERRWRLRRDAHRLGHLSIARGGAGDTRGRRHRTAGAALRVSVLHAAPTPAFVNSDGNITFEEGDDASTLRGISRLLTGRPRIAPFLSDLDPSAGGAVYARTGADAVTVTWCAVPEWDSQTNMATVQVSLLPDGHVEMTFDEEIRFGEVIVGLSPGRTSTLEAVDLSENGPTSGGDAAVGERFSLQNELDPVAVAAKFAASHPDAYDQIVIWTDRPVLFDAFAYEITIANAIRGIGQAIYAIPLDFGSEQLSSLVVMEWLDKYSDDLSEKVNGENTTMGLLGHESGHRWLAFLEFSDHNRERSSRCSSAGNGPTGAFFVDSDASVMEGNDIEDLGGGSVRDGGGGRALQRARSVRDGPAPRFRGAVVLLRRGADERVAAGAQHGVAAGGGHLQRHPARRAHRGHHRRSRGRGSLAPTSRRASHRQAFIYVVGEGRTADPDDVALLDRIRVQWETFFSEATDGRMRVETRLRATP